MSLYRTYETYEESSGRVIPVHTVADRASHELAEVTSLDLLDNTRDQDGEETQDLQHACELTQNVLETVIKGTVLRMYCEIKEYKCLI